jgi:hypothetical protein
MCAPDFTCRDIMPGVVRSHLAFAVNVLMDRSGFGSAYLKEAE